MRGLWSWREGEGADAFQWARVEFQPGEWDNLLRSEHEARGFQPPYDELPSQEQY